MICQPCESGVHSKCELGDCECPQRVATEADERADRVRAAAPDLLEALKSSRAVLIEAIGALHRHGLDVPMRWLTTEVDMHLAIAKAEGRS